MSALLLKLAAPLQSWGASSRYTTRETRTEPTKSGVLGMLASAQGWNRDHDITDLLQLKFGVRIEQKGQLVRDYQTARPTQFQEENRKKGELPDMPLTYRYYVSDACYLVVLVSQARSILETIEGALNHPKWPLFLGRRSCPPAGQLVLGIRDSYDTVEDVLTKEPWHASSWYKKRSYYENSYKYEDLEIVYDSEDKALYTQSDVPVSFDIRHRRYALRSIGRRFIPNPDNKNISGDLSQVLNTVHFDHDPMDFS